MSSKSNYRSLFWPMILIGVGLIWFLANMNIIPNFDPLTLLNLWPLLLIALGMDLLIGRRSPVIGLLIGVLTIGAAVAIVLAAPNLGGRSQLVSERFSEPVGSATSAVIDIDAASQPVRLYALNDSSSLIEAVIEHSGTIDFKVEGQAEKHVSLRQSGSNFQFFFNFADFNKRWEIGLNPGLPLRLTVDGGSGSLDLNLTGLQLSGLKVDGGSGSVNLSLPVSAKAYSVDYDGGSGSLNVNLPADTDLTLNLSGGSGSLSLRLPPNAAVRFEVRDNGSGSVSVAPALTRQSGGGGSDSGVWETSGFASAAHKITILVNNVGSGSISLR